MLIRVLTTLVGEMYKSEKYKNTCQAQHILYNSTRYLMRLMDSSIEPRPNPPAGVFKIFSSWTSNM